MSDLTDHAWSATVGAAGSASASGVVALAVSGASALACVAPAIAGISFVVGVAGSGSGIGDPVVDEFKPLSVIGGVVLSLAAAFGVANHLGSFDHSEAPAQAGQEGVSVQHINEGKRADAAQAFNATDAGASGTKASVDRQGHYVLTVKVPRPVL